jgi:hypothetical protein
VVGQAEPVLRHRVTCQPRTHVGLVCAATSVQAREPDEVSEPHGEWIGTREPLPSSAMGREATKPYAEQQQLLVRRCRRLFSSS